MPLTLSKYANSWGGMLMLLDEKVHELAYKCAKVSESAQKCAKVCKNAQKWVTMCL